MNNAQLLSMLRYRGTRDPFFANVGFLLHFDDPANPNVFPDVLPNVWSQNSSFPLNGFVSSTNSKFGGASFATRFNNGTSVSSSIAASPTAYSLGASQKFTLEGWFNRAGNPDGTNFNMRLQVNTSVGGAGDLLIEWINGNWRWVCFGDIRTVAGAQDSAWHHLAMSYDGATKYWFLDGVLQSSAAVGSTARNVNGYSIGGNSGSNIANYDYYDDCRFTFGVCRYTSTFSVPTGPYPNS